MNSSRKQGRTAEDQDDLDGLDQLATFRVPESKLLPDSGTATVAPEPPSTDELAPQTEVMLKAPETAPSAAVDATIARSGDSHEITPPLGRIELGQVIFGKYEILKLLGQGGMGTVWLVRHRELHIERALKMIVGGIATDPEARARLKREARVLALFSHPNAVAVHDARIAADAAFIEMEYVRGQSISEILKPGVPMPLDWTARILAQLCDVLQMAHEHGIVHRDLKPSNLMLVEGRPPGHELLKVLDFGIAKILGVEGGEGDELHTKTGVFIGTVAYMSPDQVTHGAVDHRSDIYSAGIMLYELLTGHRPFAGPTAIYDHINTPPPPFRTKNPRVQVPEEIERVVLRCLAKKPADRPQSARELFEDFVAADPDVEETIRVWQFERAQQGSSEFLQLSRKNGQGTKSGLLTERRKGKRSNWWRSPKAILAGAVGLLLVGIVAATILGRRPAPKTSNPGKPPQEITHIVPPKQADRAPEAPGGFRWEVSGADGRSDRLIRERDNVSFYPLGEGIYLPSGYKAVNPDDRVNGMPRIIERETDRTRFIRIAGGKYRRGDFRPGKVHERPHMVAVSDFYIQETEVTNAEIKACSEQRNDLRLQDWKKFFTVLNETLENQAAALQCPAACISRLSAQRYAQSVGGRLPREAEWEYAARSRGLEQIWAAPRAAGKLEKPKAYLSGIAPQGAFYPGPGGLFRISNKGDDETDQGVLDMTGNVREWCLDAFKPYDEILKESGQAEDKPLFDPCVCQEPDSENSSWRYVVRGGSFQLFPSDAMTFTRGSEMAKESIGDLGFRVVIDCPVISAAH